MSRVDKVQEELRHQVSLIIQRSLRDPRIGFITITRVKITPDLQEAKIYFTIMGTEENLRQDAITALNSASGFVRKLLGQRMRMKFTPQIEFIYDELQREHDRIDEIIDKLHKEKENRE